MQDEVIQWVKLYQLDLTLNAIEGRIRFLDMRDFLLKVQMHFLIYGEQMSQGQLDIYWKETDREVHLPHQFAEKKQIIASIEARTWSESMNLENRTVRKNLYLEAGISILTKPQDRFYYKAMLIKAGCDKLIYNGTVKPNNESPFEDILGEIESGKYDRYDDAEFENHIHCLVYNGPLSACDDTVSLGWPGFPHFENQIRTLFAGTRWKTYDNPEIAREPLMLSMVRGFVPNIIWLEAAKNGAPESITELINKVVDQEPNFAFKPEILSSHFGIRLNGHSGLQFSHPRNFEMLKPEFKKGQQVNPFLQCVRGYNPPVRVDEVYIETYAPSWVNSNENGKRGPPSKAAGSTKRHCQGQNNNGYSNQQNNGGYTYDDDNYEDQSEPEPEKNQQYNYQSDNKYQQYEQYWDDSDSDSDSEY